MLTNSIIDSLVMAANEDEMFLPAQFPSDLLSKPSTAGCHKNHVRSLCPDRLHGGKDRFRFHYHSRTTAVRWLIGYMMFVGRPFPYIQAPNLNQQIFLSFLQNTIGEGPCAQLRKERKDVKRGHACFSFLVSRFSAATGNPRTDGSAAQIHKFFASISGRQVARPTVLIVLVLELVLVLDFS